MNQLSDTNIENGVILIFENNLDYINSGLAAFSIFYIRIYLIYNIEYMSRDGNPRFRSNDSIINLHDIVISFKLFHILNIDVNHIKIFMNNYDVNGLVRLRK